MIALSSAYRNQERVIYKSLKQRIYVDTQHSSFVQCVSPDLEQFEFTNPKKALREHQEINCPNI